MTFLWCYNMTNVAKRNRFTIIKMEREETQFSSLILPQHCACLKVGPGFPWLWFCFKFNNLRREVVVCFADICEIVEHHS